MAHYLFNFTKKAAAKNEPLSGQAAKLLRAGLWGIGANTPNKTALAAGDRILAYVGAPERSFVGWATLADGFHRWSPREADSYPGSWDSGVSFAEATVWEDPIPIAAVWPKMPSSASNPNAHFFSGVQQIKQADFEIAYAAGGGEREMAPSPSRRSSPGEPAGPSSRALAELYGVVEKLRQFLAMDSPKKLTEEATRALFIDPALKGLGYVDLDDVDYGVQVESKDYADYVLNVEGKPAIVVEAKRLDTKLDGAHAAQVIKYASVLGVRWGLLTNGRSMRLYDRIPNLPPLERLVFEVDLADCADREDFEVRLYPDLSLLAPGAMVDGSGLDRRAAEKAARDLLTAPGSAAIAALQAELADSQLAHLTKRELAEMLDDLI